MEWEGVLGSILPAESVANRREDRVWARSLMVLDRGR